MVWQEPRKKSALRTKEVRRALFGSRIVSHFDPFPLRSRLDAAGPASVFWPIRKQGDRLCAGPFGRIVCLFMLARICYTKTRTARRADRLPAEGKALCGDVALKATPGPVRPNILCEGGTKGAAAEKPEISHVPEAARRFKTDAG